MQAALDLLTVTAKAQARVLQLDASRSVCYGALREIANRWSAT
jgi:hypothetical protein